MNHSTGEVIHSLSYISIQRIVDRLEQSFQKSFHTIRLFQDCITTAQRTFLLHQVLDVSYRPFSGETGLFYLHTHEGVFAFEIVEEPEEFMIMFKKLQNKSL